MRAERPIIYHPERQSPKQRFTTQTLKAIALAIWLYIWIPLLSTILWVMGVHVTYTHLVRAPEHKSWLLILIIMMTCNVVVSSWSIYNYTRFAGKNRRRGSAPVSHETVGKSFGVSDPETLSLLLHERRLNLHFDNAGMLVHVEPLVAEDKAEQLEESVSP
jgi:biofilm PGA synthesis protein PgaD